MGASLVGEIGGFGELRTQGLEVRLEVREQSAGVVLLDADGIRHVAVLVVEVAQLLVERGLGEVCGGEVCLPNMHVAIEVGTI